MWRYREHWRWFNSILLHGNTVLCVEWTCIVFNNSKRLYDKHKTNKQINDRDYFDLYSTHGSTLSGVNYLKGIWFKTVFLKVWRFYLKSLNEKWWKGQYDQTSTRGGQKDWKYTQLSLFSSDTSMLMYTALPVIYFHFINYKQTCNPEIISQAF